MANKKFEQPVTFTREAAARIANAVRAVEGNRLGNVNAAGGGGGFPFGGLIRPAVVTTAIPTGSPSAPSASGVVTLQDADDTTDGALVAGDTGITVRNYHSLSASIAAGKTVAVYWFANSWWLLAADC